MPPYRVDRPRVEIRRLLVPFAIFGVVLGMAVVALTLLASLLWVGYLLWGIAFPPLGENLAAMFLPLTAPFIPVVWFVGGLLLWGLRGILRGLLDWLPLGSTPLGVGAGRARHTMSDARTAEPRDAGA